IEVFASHPVAKLTPVSRLCLPEVRESTSGTTSGRYVISYPDNFLRLHRLVMDMPPHPVMHFGMTGQTLPISQRSRLPAADTGFLQDGCILMASRPRIQTTTRR